MRPGSASLKNPLTVSSSARLSTGRSSAATGSERRSQSADARRGRGVRQHPGARGREERRVAGRGIEMLVRVENLPDGPAALGGAAQAGLPVQRVDHERLAGLGAGDEIMVVAQLVGRPDAFDNHEVEAYVIMQRMQPGIASPPP